MADSTWLSCTECPYALYYAGPKPARCTACGGIWLQDVIWPRGAALARPVETEQPFSDVERREIEHLAMRLSAVQAASVDADRFEVRPELVAAVYRRLNWYEPLE
jgi:hypothetical protein